MKKHFFFIAAAALALGMASCSDDVVDIIDNNSEEPATEIAIKSVADLVGTEWEYSPEDLVLVDEMGDTVGTIEMSDLTFQLNFDAADAHLLLPEDMAMLSLVDNNGTMEPAELNQMSFSYTYELATTSGMLTATDNDITGETIDMQIPFFYEAANDAIVINLTVAEDADGTNTTALQLYFQRHANND